MIYYLGRQERRKNITQELKTMYFILIVKMIMKQELKKEIKKLKEEKISIRLDKKLLDDLTYGYIEYNLFEDISFSEYIRRKLKKGEQK